jgi:hypothetical protein
MLRDPPAEDFWLGGFVGLRSRLQTFSPTETGSHGLRIADLHRGGCQSPDTNAVVGV